jgi:hypothetical protein
VWVKTTNSPQDVVFYPGFIVGFVLFNGRFMFFVEALNISSRW